MSANFVRIFGLCLDVAMAALWNLGSLKMTFHPGFKDVNITSSILMTCDISDKTRCNMICTMTRGCMSYFYNPYTERCQFHSDVFTRPDGGAVQEGLRYYYKGVRDGYQHLHYRNTHLIAKRHSDIQTWDGALRVCQSEDATLVKLDTEDKCQAFQKIMDKNHNDYLWIGLSDRFDNDSWLWTDNTPLGRYNLWSYGEPQNINHGRVENCVAARLLPVFNVPKWYDSYCKFKRKFVCEKIHK